MTPANPTSVANTCAPHAIISATKLNGKVLQYGLHLPVLFSFMNPVAIFRCSPAEGPGYFAIFLEARRIPWRLIPLDAAAVVPERADAYSGLCFMGGPMSVNDDLPWIAPVCALIRDAVDKDIPVLGHCLGGQLMSKALGGTVGKNPVQEIGWHVIEGGEGAVCRHWLGAYAGKALEVFQWHSETFSLPEGATLVAGNAVCARQMFAIGAHFAMQCHIEMTPEMIAAWCAHWAAEADAGQTSVQTPATIAEQTPIRLPIMRGVADQIYGVWVCGLTRLGKSGERDA
jgi:GMP synthase-like glutamine amidotransferase